MRTSEQIQAEIKETLGFFPPFFSPAQQSPQVLENLWQQTLAADVNNPLSTLFKEKLSAYLSRYCTVPYCLICHSCALRQLGVRAQEVLQLLESPPPTAADIDQQLQQLATRPEALSVLPEPNSELEENLLNCSIFIFLKRDQAESYRRELSRLLGAVNYEHLVTFAAYVKTCHIWMEAHPEVSYENDKRAQDHLGALLAEEPGLASFFRNYREQVSQESQTWAVQPPAVGDRQWHQELRQIATENLQLSRAITSVSDGILITDPNQANNPIIYANPAFCHITGYQPEEVIGRNCRFLQGADTDPQVINQLRQAIAARQEIKATLLNYRKDGQPFWNELRISTVFSEEGKLLYFIGIQTDITEKKQLEAQLLRSQRLESISTLASGIAHDLNNVLTPILMAVQLLEKKLVDPQSQWLLETLETSTKRGADLVKQVMSFARGLAGERTTLQARHLILEIKQLLKETFPATIEVHTDVAQDLWPIPADTSQLHQVLMNLCINARDAMPTGGSLNLAAENLFIDESYAYRYVDAEVGPYIVVTVTDTGVGIPADQLDRIFEPFFTTKGPGKGTGLGLSTVIGIVKSHNGFITVQSQLGQGTQFQVYLPAIATVATPKPEAMELPTGQGELVLVVDDEASIREITKTSLEVHNYQALTASDGIEAVALYVQHPDEISVVLVDMMMPSMDGLTTIRTLQKINSQVKIIAVSGLLSSNTTPETVGTGVQACLSKPYTAKDLLKTLHQVLSGE